MKVLSPEPVANVRYFISRPLYVRDLSVSSSVSGLTGSRLFKDGSAETMGLNEEMIINGEPEDVSSFHSMIAAP